MTEHTHTVITPGCYRCDLNLEEIEAAIREIAGDAQAAWVAYRDNYMRRHGLTSRQVSSQLRRREFVAGYMAANQ